ncbi:MAG: ADP-ribosylglycohydrolase family protein [Myxococcales bacterium]|nr:ADP-ribosylglycohydrolase family protein [Myxococcales bacterium]
MTPQEPTYDAFAGSLLGGALGDALGYPIEFQSASEIVLAVGTSAPSSIACDGEDVALISDDTQMTLFTGEGMIRPGFGASLEAFAH